MSEQSQRVKHALEAKAAYLVPCVYHFYRQPPLLVRGDGTQLFDADGNAYLDFFSGVSVNHLGHCHPEVTEAICRQARTLCHTTTIYLTEPMLELAAQLTHIAPSPLARAFFCASGTEANETGVFLAQRHTGRSGVLALENGLHGNSKLTLSLTGIAFWKHDLTPVADVVHAPTPYCYRCPFDCSPDSCSLECAQALVEQLDQSPVPVGAMILELVQANGGVVVPPLRWLKRIREILQERDILLLVDEVQTALGRTGKLFAVEHFGLEPDILSMAKSIGGGLPMGVSLSSEKVAADFICPRASTFGGNLVAAKAAATVLHVIRRDELPARAAESGRHLRDGLLALQQEYPCIGDVRGLGLMLGAELVDSDGSPAPELTDDLLEAMKDRGVLIGKGGQARNVLVFMPPLVVSQAEIEHMLEILAHCLAEIDGTE